MDFYKNLPLPARIAVPALLALVVAFVAYSMMLKPPKPLEVVTTRDVGVYNLAKSVLDHKAIDYHEESADEMFSLTVSPGDISKASRALAESGVKDTTSTVKKIKCPAAPGFTATRAANERADNCAAAKSVQEMLLSAGAIGANVQVSQEENGRLLGPEKAMNVVAQVFLPPSMENEWDAHAAARAIAGSVGTTINRVYIGDDKLDTLFDGTATSGTNGSDSTSTASGLGCGDIAGATEVETKRAAVRNCYKESIGSDLTELLGGSDRYVLSVEPTIDSVSSTTTTLKNSPGAEISRSEQTGSGQKAIDKDTPANTTETMSTDPAGDIKSLKISVILDKENVTEDQRSAVLSLLSSHIEPKRGDPAPVVKMSQFGAGGGDKPRNEDLEAIKASTQQSSDPLANTSRTVIQPEIPTWAIAVMAVLVIGVLTAMLVLWRKSAAMAGERERLEQSFRQEQRLFENYTQQNPDALAQDLNALFGAPSAPEPTYRS